MKRALFLLGGGLVVGAGILLSFPRSQPFPHEKHATLFPTCQGCHGGVFSGDTTETYTIAPEDCASCHDGVELDEVDWTGPTREPTNLAFTHPLHEEELREHGEDPAECADCHGVPGAEGRMEVVRLEVENCLTCHAPEAEEHLAATGECTTCHLPLARAEALPAVRVESFPRPPDHERPEFLAEHGAEAGTGQCAVCHARDSCERCHLNASELPAVAGLERDERIATLVAGRPGEWFEPASHEEADWLFDHRVPAREDLAECANCHAQESCMACHRSAPPAPVTRLVVARPGGPQGVEVEALLPAGGHTPEFVDRHATAATVGMPDCTTCHTERWCVDCHDAERRPSFHPVDFVARHGADAFANDSECAACHSREGFCRDCHAGVGMRVAGQTTGGSFHDAQADWLLAHGLAARQNLESCTTCHEQSSCLRCHSAKAGLRLNPHGDDFEAARAADRSTQSCAICHFALPGGIEP